MSTIKYAADDFAPGTLPASGAVPAREAHLIDAAVRMGDVSMFGGPRRPLIELLWRFAMVRSALDIRSGQWQKSAAYHRLDGTEKGSVSYFLGMVQASHMARSLLNVTDVAHVDAVLRLRGQSTRRSRPDLVGYTGTPSHASSQGRVLIEAKGRSGDYAQHPITSAKVQLATPPRSVAQLVGSNSLSVASLAYFSGGSTWTSYLCDPPPSRENLKEVDDEVFRGLVSLASLMPVASAIENLARVAESRVKNNPDTDMIEATLPDVGVTIGMPLDTFRQIREFAPEDDEVSDVRAANWAQRVVALRSRVEERRVEVAQRRDGRQFTFDRDGILVDVTADFRPETN